MEQCTKESVSIQCRSSSLVFRPTKSCNVKMRQKASLNQARVKRVLAVGLQNHLQNSTVMYDHQGSYYFQCHHM